MAARATRDEGPRCASHRLANSPFPTHNPSRQVLLFSYFTPEETGISGTFLRFHCWDVVEGDVHQLGGASSPVRCQAALDVDSSCHIYLGPFLRGVFSPWLPSSQGHLEQILRGRALSYDVPSGDRWGEATESRVAAKATQKLRTKTC